MTKEMTLYQIEKAQEFAKYLKLTTEVLGYFDLDLALTMFNKVNGINEDDECYDCPCDDVEVDTEKYKWNVADSTITEYMNYIRERLDEYKGLFNDGKIESNVGTFTSPIFSGEVGFVEANVCCNCNCKSK